MLVNRFEELRIWQDAKSLTVEIYSLIRENKDYGFRDQLQRASVSIMNNIAEGFESGSNAMFLRYLHIAKGSCGEVRSMLLLSYELNYISKDKKDILQKAIYISQGIKKLIDRIKSRG